MLALYSLHFSSNDNIMTRMDSNNNLRGYDMDIMVDKVPYHTRVTPVDYNGQKRFHVKIGSGEDHVFVWDAEMMSLKALDDSASTLPDNFVRELSDRLVKVVDLGMR